MTTQPSSEGGSFAAWALRAYSKLLCGATLLLILAGGMVTSKNAGLSVPDWPTSYGYAMWNLPFALWQGGVFYEHSHRVIASVIGLLTLALCVWLLVAERRRWVRRLGGLALAAVIVQGVLGGLTVRLRLPLPVSVAHGMLAQTFLVLTIVIAYSQSCEWHARAGGAPVADSARRRGVPLTLLVLALIYLQLAVGAVMRHDMKGKGGVAVPDFPTVAGRWIPSFTDATLERAQAARDAIVTAGKREFEAKITLTDIVIHVAHRATAGVIAIVVAAVSVVLARRHAREPAILRSIYLLDAVLIVQIMLGAFTVWTQKGEWIASLHVVTGAAVLGAASLLILRVWPFPTARRTV